MANAIARKSIDDKAYCMNTTVQITVCSMNLLHEHHSPDNCVQYELAIASQAVHKLSFNQIRGLQIHTLIKGEGSDGLKFNAFYFK